MSNLKIVEGNGGLWGMDKASEYLGIEKSTLYQITMRRQIPVVKVGRLNRFRQQDLDAWIETHVQEAIKVEQ